ncbi:MAG: AI-2E family transporter [Clostridia bacterium]|nr:AI-2E family transporter [Clostridia bacterium]
MLKRFYNQKYMSIAAHATLGIAAVILVVALFVRFGEIRTALGDLLAVLRPITIGLVLAYFCNPLMKLGERYVFGWVDRLRHVPRITKRVLSLLLSYLLIVAVIAGVLLLVLPELINNYESLIGNLTSFVLKGVSWADEVLNLVNADSVAGLIQKNSDRLLGLAASLLAEAVATVTGAVATLTISLVLSFFMLIHKEVWTAGLKRTVAAILPRRSYAELCDILTFANRTFGRYLVGSVFDSLLVGCEVYLLLLIFGVPYSGLVSVMVGVTNIIPYFGPFIGAIPSFFIILTQDTFKAFLFLVLILVVQQIDGNFINPRIIGKTTNINSMWVILAITVIGGWLGILGMLIAIPLFSVIYMLVRRAVHARLARRGLPISREAYASVFSVSHYRKHGEAAPAEGGDTDTSTEKEEEK